jgi:hypothetical protein
MRKVVLLMVAMVAAVVVGVVVYNSKPSIKLLEELPTESLLPYRDCSIEVANGEALVVPQAGKSDSGIEIQGNYDLSEYKCARFTIENIDPAPLYIYVTFAHDNIAYYRSRCVMPMAVGHIYYLKPGEKSEIEMPFPRPLENPDVEQEFFKYGKNNMLYTPYSHAFGLASYAGDLSRVKQILFKAKSMGFGTQEQKGWRLSDFEIVAGKRKENPKAVKMSHEEFFPFVDKYGQYKHHEWEGKVHSDEDMQRAIAVEEADLASHIAPASFNKYGGWAEGPRQEATGRFYLKKVDGKWWFVDPEGCLWWSHGVVRVTPSSAVTPIDNRKFYFENLPEKGSEFEKFYYTHDALLKPYYTQRGHKETYDFSSANIYRKYGENYLEKYGEMAHRRLRSWGMNTIANSSDKDICLMSKTPYIERLEIHSAPIEGTGGLWWQISDPFDSSFKKELIEKLQARERELKDPYLVGLFVDNELKWGGESYLAEKAAQNPATAAVKRELVKYYQKKYKKICKLNEAWGSSFASWRALLDNTQALPKQASADLVEFNDLIIHGYFSNIREVFNEYAPGVLYLGCRFAGRSSNRRALYIGAEYCDAISHNMYNFTLADYRQPEGIDKPMIIGEFHFGTMNQGMFHHSLVRVENQKERGEAYANYVRSALEHPQVVGTHWHQFSDQATSGRFDGENLQVGFTDVCDTPYYETIEGIRKVGYNMYDIRYKAVK